MIGDAAAPEHSGRHDRAKGDRDGESGTGQQIEVVWPWIKQARQEDDNVGDKADRHHGERLGAVGYDEHAAYNRQ